MAHPTESSFKFQPEVKKPSNLLSSRSLDLVFGGRRHGQVLVMPFPPFL